MNLEQKIEAILFYKNEPQTIKKLAEILAVTESEVKESIDNLAESLKNRGICLITNEKEVALATNQELSTLIESVAKGEMSEEIGKAGLETLAIILYNQGVSRREIDYIRGVNSAFILRNLSIRGLIEKEQNPADQRTFRYKPTLALLAHLGLHRREDLPQFTELQQTLRTTLEQQNENQDNNE
jgi:segregation and condensation protein B